MGHELKRRLLAFLLAVLAGSIAASLLAFGWFGIEALPFVLVVGGAAGLITGVPVVLILHRLRVYTVWGYLGGGLAAGVALYLLILAMNLRDSIADRSNLLKEGMIWSLPWLLIYVIAALTYWWVGVRKTSSAVH